jgi:hypothetical protein
MPLIFLCYRRSDTGGVAGRLYDRLLQEYTDEEVFRDIDDIPGGANFVAASERALENAQAFVALVGKDWLNVTSKTGKPRLAKPSDRVRIEVEMAIRLEVPILPVLVDGAEMPASDDLPESMSNFAFFNARHLDAHSFDHHVDEIMRSLEQLAGPGGAGPAPGTSGNTGTGEDTETGSGTETGRDTAEVTELANLIPGMWQLQIQYPNGFVGQASAQFLPNGQFVVQGVAGQTFEIQGLWQIDPMGSLQLSGQQTDGFNVLPYESVFQFTSTGQQQMQGSASTGEQTTWTRVG